MRDGVVDQCADRLRSTQLFLRVQNHALHPRRRFPAPPRSRRNNTRAPATPALKRADRPANSLDRSTRAGWRLRTGERPFSTNIQVHASAGPVRPSPRPGRIVRSGGPVDLAVADVGLMSIFGRIYGTSASGSLVRDLGGRRLPRGLRFPSASVVNGPSRNARLAMGNSGPTAWFPPSPLNPSQPCPCNVAVPTAQAFTRASRPTLSTGRGDPHTNKSCGCALVAALILQDRAAGSLERLSADGSLRTDFVVLSRPGAICLNQHIFHGRNHALSLTGWDLWTSSTVS